MTSETTPAEPGRKRLEVVAFGLTDDSPDLDRSDPRAVLAELAAVTEPPEPLRNPRYDELAAYVRKTLARKPTALHQLADVIAGQLAGEFPMLRLADAGVLCMYLNFYLQVGVAESANAQLMPLTPANTLALLALVGERLFTHHQLQSTLGLLFDAVEPLPAEAIPTAEQCVAAATAADKRRTDPAAGDG